MAPEGHRPRPRRLHRARPSGRAAASSSARARATTPSRSTARRAAPRCAARCRVHAERGSIAVFDAGAASTTPSTQARPRAARRLGPAAADARAARRARRPTRRCRSATSARVVVMPAERRRRRRRHRRRVAARLRGRARAARPRAPTARRRRRRRPRSMDASQVIIRPVVSEKSYVLIAEIGKYTFRVHADAHKTQIRQAVEQLFDVKVRRRPHRVGQEQAEAPRRLRRPHAHVEEGDRAARAGRHDPDLPGPARAELSNADPQAKADEPRRRFVDLSRLRRDHAQRAREVARRGPDEVRRPQRARPQDRPPPRRRRQAALPRDRLQAPQGRRAGEGRARSSTTPTAPPTSRCCTTSTARSATSSRRSGSRSA